MWCVAGALCAAIFRGDSGGHFAENTRLIVQCHIRSVPQICVLGALHGIWILSEPKGDVCLVEYSIGAMVLEPHQDSPSAE